MKILITGGHPTPAFAVIEKLKQLSDVKILFVGRKYALENEKSLSFEYKQAIKEGIYFYNLTAAKFSSTSQKSFFKNLLKFFIGIWQSFRIIKNEKPDVILSFGSYLAVPVCLVGFVFRKRIYLHEQTSVPGLANKINSFFSSKIMISFPDSKNKFPKMVQKKIILVGNPVRESIFQIRKNPFKKKIIKKNRKVLYFTGGSLGSHSINLHLFSILDKLLMEYYVIHQIGGVKKYKDFKVALQKKKELGRLGKFYFPKEHFLKEEIGFVYNIADIVISRAGANTFFELLALEKPTVFIPLPWSAGGEQAKHALLFKKNGCGEVFNQRHLSDELYDLIKKVDENYEQYKSSFYKLKEIYKKDATDQIISEIFKAI